MIRTELGPVDLRRPRQHEKIRLHRGSGADVAVAAKWLAKDAKHKDRDSYRIGVMQAMMIASTKMALKDLAGKPTIDPETGMLRSVQKTRDYKKRLEDKLEKLKIGRDPVPVKNVGVASQVGQQGAFATRHLGLLKRGQRAGRIVTRYFSIDGGNLKEWKSGFSLKPKHIYNLSDVEARYEYSGMKGVAEEFGSTWPQRVKVQLRDRPHGPIYLASQDPRTAKSWERAIKMSKYLQSASDREALAFVVGRLAGSVMTKGWDALFTYFREMKETKLLVRNLAQRLLRVDLSRGWTKARLVYLQKVESEKRRNEQKEWAAKFLKEQLDRINCQAARSPKQVRQTIISQIQTKFRHYRQEKIFDRAYPLGASVSTRLQQAQSGATMVAAFESVSRDDALHLVLNDDSREHLQTNPAVFHGRKSTYSEVTVQPSPLSINVSESFAMLSFAELDDEAEHSHLAKEGWAHFVNLDQISSVILHSKRMLTSSAERPELDQATRRGVWFTINGPRVCWCRQIRSAMDPRTKKVQRDVVGATNPLVVGSALAKGERLRWLKITVQCKSSYISSVQDEDPLLFDGGDHSDQIHKSSGGGLKDRQMYLTLHLLGRTFHSERAMGDSPIFPGRFEVDVPISYDEYALTALDETDICVEIMAVSEDSRVGDEALFVGRCKLWEVFAGGAPGDSLVSLAQTLNTSTGRVAKVFQLVPPVPQHHNILEKKATAQVDLDFIGRMQEAAEPGRKSVSPELHGRGSLTTLFSTHRGAWFDPKLGDAKFLADRVANFVELSVFDLALPDSDSPDATKNYKYYVMAMCNGIRVCTVPLTRFRQSWTVLRPLNPNVIDYKGSKIYLPLPPGAWCSHEVRPEIDVQIVRFNQIPDRAVGFRELIQQHGKPAPATPPHETVYHASVLLDGMLVDEAREDCRIYLSRSSAPKGLVKLSNGECSPMEAPAMLRVNATLRDRDYVRLNSSRPHAGQANPGSVLCVGDKAMLKVEETILYPQTELEFRRRCMPDSFDSSRAHSGSVAWSAKLREPSMSHEYADSGLERVQGAPPFKQRYLPNNCEDVIPYMYVLPTTEIDFVKSSRPGVYWRIMDRLAERRNATRSSNDRPSINDAIIVEELSHLMKDVPCTVLSVYANDTCDLEIAPAFVEEWEKTPHRQYTVPGSVTVKKFQDTSLAALRSAPTGTGDVSERYRLRVVLREVPIHMVMSVQPASFNIYDASFGSVDDAIKLPPARLGNDFNPRGMVDFADQSFAADRRGGYAIHAGPVPADAGPTCLYEWSLHLHAETEDDMYHFVTALRQSVRIDLHQQLIRLNEWKHKSALSNTTMPYRSALLTSSAGHLEVVLVEAKHLKPPKVRKQNVDVWMSKPGEATTMWVSSLSSFSPKAVFRMFRQRKGAPPEELVYRGSKTQTSPEIAGPNPNWATVEGMESSGGWVFKSPPFDPKVGEDEGYFFEIEFFKRRVSIGKVRVPVCGAAPSAPQRNTERVELCSVERPFHNLWIPLFSGAEPSPAPPPVEEDPAGDPGDKPSKESFALGFMGKAHVMTFWVPQREPANYKHWPKKALDWRRYQLRPKLNLERMYEWLDESSGVRVQKSTPPHIDLIDSGVNHAQKAGTRLEISVRKMGYNPNLSTDPVPPNRHKIVAGHIEAIDNSVPYLECHETSDLDRWYRYARTRATPTESIAELVEHERTNFTHMCEMEDMFRFGVPRLLRRHIWFQIAGGEQFVLEADTQRTGPAILFSGLVEYGRRHAHEAVRQLSEDFVVASTWEAIDQPSLMESHLNRVARAQDICLALIAFSRKGTDGATNGPPHDKVGPGICYSESLLLLSFYMMLGVAPTGKKKILPPKSASPSASTMSMGTSATMNTPVDDGPFPGRVSFHNALGSNPSSQQQKRDDSRVFWTLYALAGRKESPFFHYFGGANHDTEWALRRSPMDDLRRLDHCLACRERELWVHLNAVGFQLPQVFYAAFIRFYATFLPTPTAYRLWDLLFFEACTADHLEAGQAIEEKPGRHVLIDLAYATITKTKDKLMLCQSAQEVKATLLHFLENLYDPAEAITLVNEAEFLLWTQTKQILAERAGVQIDHVREYKRSTHLWFLQMRPFMQQVAAVKWLVEETGLTTVKATLCIRKIRGLWAAENIERGTFVGMQHQLPTNLLKYGPEIDTSWMGYLAAAYSRYSETFDVRAPITTQSIPLPSFMPAATMGEPTNMDQNDFERQIKRSLADANWGPYLLKIFQAFVSQTDRRLSMNEFFVSLLCASRGTVGEKAIELFNLFASTLPNHAMHHINHNPAVTTILDKIDANLRLAIEGKVARPPKEDAYKNHALHFQIWSHTSGNNEMLLGETFIPSLRPYIWNSMGKEVPVSFSIFGMEKQLPPGFAMTTTHAQALLHEHGVRSPIGTMSAVVKWIPSSEATPEIGQLGIRLHSITFDMAMVKAHSQKNPRVSVQTYDENGEPRKIKRWDPRGLFSKGTSATTANIIGGGAYGEHIDFGSTMRRDMTGGLHTRAGSGGGIGWDAASSKWLWNEKWGDQYSIQKFKMRKDFVQGSGEKPNAISLFACRMIVKDILSRRYSPLTNRQAMLIADDAFNRAGAVACILGAIVVPADALNQPVNSLAQLKQMMQDAGRHYLDVTHQVVMAYERSIDAHPGDLSLFPGAAGAKAYSFSSLEINDPYPGSHKVLWVRFARAGDGERLNAQIQVDGSGSFHPQNIPMELDSMSSAVSKMQMSVTREEFVACIISHPMLSEALGRATLADYVYNNSFENKEFHQALNLDVTIADPKQENEDDDFMDLLNARQGVCFEVWDYDLSKKDDFLGECWLPPLSTLRAEPKQFILPITSAPVDQDPTMSRPSKMKYSGNQPIACQGNLFVEAAWRYPHQDVDEAGADESLEARVKKDEIRHTGELYIKIIKAVGLRQADKKIMGMNVMSSSIMANVGSDPYVYVYVRNEAAAADDKAVPGIGEGGWRKSTVTGFDEPIMKTSYKKATVNPVWEEEKRILLQSGTFEKRTKRRALGLHMLDVTGRAGQLREDQHAIDVIYGSEEMHVQFRADPKAAKLNHSQITYMSDTIHQFKLKLKQACEDEAAVLDAVHARTQKDEKVTKAVTRWREAGKNISYRHCVTVFIPSPRLRELSQQLRHNTNEPSRTAIGSKEFEYKRLWKLEMKDPSSWQPLETIQTFETYKAYGFGKTATTPLQIRIVEGTANFRLRSERYRHFLEAQKSLTRRVETLNVEGECYGWARYTHNYDGGSQEWRPAIMDRPLASTDGTRRFRTWFIHSLTDQATSATPGEAPKHDLESRDVLLAPPNPQILGSMHAEHKEFLQKVKRYHDVDGLKDSEIVTRLNAEMKAKYERHRGYDYATMEPITLADVQHILGRDELGSPTMSSMGTYNNLYGTQQPTAGTATTAPPTNSGPLAGGNSPSASFGPQLTGGSSPAGSAAYGQPQQAAPSPGM